MHGIYAWLGRFTQLSGLDTFEVLWSPVLIAINPMKLSKLWPSLQKVYPSSA